MPPPFLHMCCSGGQARVLSLFFQEAGVVVRGSRLVNCGACLVCAPLNGALFLDGYIQCCHTYACDRVATLGAAVPDTKQQTHPLQTKTVSGLQSLAALLLRAQHIHARPRQRAAPSKESCGAHRRHTAAAGSQPQHQPTKKTCRARPQAVPQPQRTCWRQDASCGCAAPKSQHNAVQLVQPLVAVA